MRTSAPPSAPISAPLAWQASPPAWAEPRIVALIIAGYLLMHLAVRLWMGPVLGMDDAEQALFAQHWLPNYRFRAPPLFTWALVAAGGVTGVGMLAISLLRYALLAMIFGFTYLTARRLIRDPTLAALATYSFTAIYVFGYYSHHDLTHTTTLAAFIAASWYVLVRLCETPTLRWYLALGLCFGLGMLGKWNFAILAVALPLACLAHPTYRSLVLTWKIVPAALLAAAIVLPTVAWTLHVGPAQGDDVGGVLGRPSGAFLIDLIKGTADLALALFTYPQPFLVIFLLFFGWAAWAGLRTARPPAPEPHPVPDSRLVGTVIAIAVALHWLLVPLAGATDFAERLLQPALQILPIYLFMLVEEGGVPASAIRPYAITLAVITAVALVARIGIHVAGADYCRGVCRTLVPFAEVAAGLRGAGYQGEGTIAVRGVHPAGNLRVQFPHARIMEIGYPARSWPKPSAASGQCLAVWVSETRDGRGALEAYLARELGVPIQAPRKEGVITSPMQGSTTRTYRVHYMLYDQPQGDCR